ncbi:MAG TPA: helix-turn-helix transcriptional regulator [Bacillota bacterium]|nr:helix-turn-helix transcriptional regulator [Bacillota bacterium]
MELEKSRMFVKRLKQEREIKGITQKELGALLGVTDRAVGLWETGRRMPDADMLLKLAEIFDCTVDYLLGATNERKSRTGTDFDPEMAEIFNRAKKLSPEGREYFKKAVKWIFEVDKDREALKKLKGKAKKDFMN